MSDIDAILAAIAKDHLGIETLETRQSDRLDFHAIPVWSIRRALNVAFLAGQKNPTLTDPVGF